MPETETKQSSKVSHTPGPWEARIFNNRDGFGIFAAGIERSITSANLYEHFAYTGFFGPEVTEANARLIAAAPEMLEALESLDNVFHLDALATHYPSSENAIKKVKAAIRKAKGEL